MFRCIKEHIENKKWRRRKDVKGKTADLIPLIFVSIAFPTRHKKEGTNDMFSIG